MDYWETKFCSEHWGQYPHCRFCGRLVPPHHQESSGGKTRSVRCPTCRASSIDHIHQARPIFARLVQWVNDQGLIYNNLNLRIEFRNRNQLNELINKSEENTSLGATLQNTVIKNGQKLFSKVEGVAILRGLPSTLFQGVTVHELGHAWLIVHNIVDLPAWAEEGFCELLTYRYYTQFSTQESSYYAMGIEKNPHPDYGGGFRRLRAMDNEIGFSNLIPYLRYNLQLPTNN